MGVCDVPVISTVCDTAGEAAASLISAPFDWLAQAMGAAAGWLFEAVWSVFDTTTLVDVTSPEYVAVYNILFGIAVFVMLLFFCLQLITGLIRRDPTALSRAALGLAKSVLGSFVVITLTALLLEIVDQLCVGIIQAAGETTESMGDKIALLAAGLTAINLTAPGVGAIVTIFLGGLMVAAVAIVWFSLLIRKALLLIAIVLGGIYGGVFTPTEAAAVAATYAFFITVFVYKELKLSEVPKVLLQAASMSSMLLYIITNAVLFSFLMTHEQIPQEMAAWIIDKNFSVWMFLLVVNVILLLAGNVMDPSSILLIMAPILFPLATKLGVHPVHLGILMIVNTEVGLCHPPVGLNLYIASSIAKMGISEITIAVLPWLCAMLVFLGLITYVPEISLWLPRLLGMI